MMSGHIMDTDAATEAAELSQHNEAEDAEDASITDISLIQHSTGAVSGKGRLDSLRENLYKQQERLMALRERALRKTEDGGQRLSNMSDSMESLKSLGQMLTQHKELRPQDMSTPLVTPTKDVSLAEISGSEKLQMLNQRTEQTRALIEQRKRDLAKSLQSVKSGLRHSASSELGSSMSDLRTMAQSQAPPVSRHRSAADLLQQQQQQLQLQQQTAQQLPAASDESRLKLMKNKMKLIEMKQTRKEQELQQELLDLRNELARRDEVIQQQESTLSEQSEQLSSLRPLSELENPRLQAEIEQLRERNAELEASSDMLETTRHELQTVREQLLLEQQATSEASANTTDAQVNQELAKQLQELENQLQELRQANAQKEEAEQQQQEQGTDTEAQSKLISELEATIAQQSEQLAEKTTELNVLNVNLRVLEEKLAQSVKSKPIFLDEQDGGATEQLQADLVKLKQKLDECNKSNIKLKLKCKQAEKQLQKFQSTDSQQELAKIRAENEELQQRITVLEDEKGQWQLAQVDEEPAVAVAAANAAAAASSGQAEAIRLLEEQKQELEQALEALQQGSDAARVESELNEVQLEEQLSQRVQQLEAEANEQREQLQKLQGEKEALDKKLSHYINENMELLDKLEKLSSSSSAESIEIVERPSERRFSQQRPASEGDEPAEVEVASSNAALPSFVSELTQTDLEEAAPEQLEMNESLAQLRTESDELLQKIQLFTDERREVLAKMEQLQAENATLQEQLKEAQEQSQAEQAALQSQLEEVQRDKQQLSLQLTEKSSNLSQELSSMQRSSEVVASLDCGAEGGGAAPLFDKCERSLSKLSSELEAYRKANDRNAKLNVSKKLAKEAKNVHTQLTELLNKVKEASTAVETVTVVETVVAVTAPNGKALAEYEQLTAQNAELKAALARLQAELEELRDSYPDEPVQLAIAAQHELEGVQKQELEKQLQQREKELQKRVSELEREKQLEREQLERELLRVQHVHDVERQLLRESITELEATIEELRATTSEQLQLIGSQSAELVQLQLQAEQHDQVLNKSEMIHEKYMEQQQRLRHELDARIETLEQGQSILQTLVAEQKQQLIEAYSQSEHETNLKLLELQQCQAELETSETRNKELRDKLKKYAVNLKKRTVEHAELEQQLQRLRAEQEEQPEQEEQLQAALAEQIMLEMKLKSALAEQTALELKLSEEQATVEQQEEQLQQLRDQLHDLQRTKKELERDLAKQHIKLSTIPKLREDVDRLQVELQNTVFANTSLRQESYELEKQLEARAGYDELRRQLEQKSLKFDKSKEVIKLRNATIQSLQRELAELRNQLQAQPEEEPLQKLQAAQQLHQQRAEEQQQREEEQAKLLAQLLAAKEQNAQLLEEKANFELAIARLETLHEGIQAKLQQDQTYIESLEAQSAELQAKSAALEDQAASLTAEHSRAQEHVQLLEQQLRETSEQQTEHETQLQQRVQQLQEREQNQSRQLQQLSSEAEEARAELIALQATHDALLARHKQHTQQAQAEREEMSNNSEQELHELRQQLQERDQELQRQRNVYDAKLAAKVTELDEMECDLSAHMERATAETRELTQQLERAQEQLQARSEELARINEELADTERERAALSREAVLLRMQHDSAEQDVLELQELRMQAMQDKTEMDNLRAQIDSLCANHNQELQALQQQIAELDTLGQNQTDDQVYIETENKRLTEHLTELQARLEELQHQQQSQPTVPAPALFQTQSQSQPADDWMYSAAWQRQPGQEHSQVVHAAAPPPPAQNVPTAMFFGGDAAAAPSPFDEIVAPPLRVGTQNLGVPPPDPASMEPTIEDLQRNVSDLEKHAKELETKLLARNQTLAEHEERRQQLERQLQEREQELAQLRAQAEERERVAAIEKLMMPDDAEPAPLKAAAPTLDMFFGPETVPDAAAISLDLGLTQSEPVVEPLIIPKKAYVCQPEQEQELSEPTPVAQQAAIDWGVGDMDEDPWASAAAAAAAVAEQTPPAATSALQARIDELEQQKAELQTKTAKLMKRLKEYRAKEQQQQQQQELMTMSKNMSNDLDSAIIDELKHQLQLHEARQSKTEELLQQNALEKEKLAKRIDVLTAGNERMAELKERQDMDVQMYQARIRELQEKLQQLESWGEEGGAGNVHGGAQISTAAPAAALPPSESTTAEALAKIENLQAENLDLNTECQELQAQLQQEKQLVQDALAKAQLEREQLQAEKLQVEQERQLLQEQLEQLREQLQEQLQEEREQLQQLQEQLRQQRQQQQEQWQEQRQEQLQEEREQLQQLQEQVRQQRQQQQEQWQEQQEQWQEQRQEQLQEEREQLQQLQEQLRQQLEEQAKQMKERQSKQVEELLAKQLEQPTTALSDESLALLQEKESEIVHLKQRIEELMREDQTEKLVLEILTKNQELHMLRMQIKQLQEEEEKQEKPEVLETQSEANKQLEQVQQQLEQVQQQCQQLQQEKHDMEEELRVLNNHVLSSLELEDKMKQTVLELDMKNIELTELRKSLELLQQAQAQAQQPPSSTSPPAQTTQPDLSALNKQWEALVEQKCSEVATIWQGHLQQREAAYEEQIAQLKQQQQQQTPLPTTTQAVLETGAELPPTSELVAKMQKALETQEMEIVTLKEQLAIRSAEYARLASQYDPFRLQNTLQGGAASGPAATGSSQDGQAEYVLKSDLDYALMMLHQRDMRIEEMIIELVQLLDERDHLQLKLSDTLRQLEAERSRGTLDDFGSTAGPQGNVSFSSVASGSPGKISISSSSDLVPSSGGSDLKHKLAELQTVKHSRDKAIVDERELRLQQMIQLQRATPGGTTTSAAAAAATTITTAPTTTTIPAAAAAATALPAGVATTTGVPQLDNDPSQTSLRSPSMVLMDWILGNNKNEDEGNTGTTSN